MASEIDDMVAVAFPVLRLFIYFNKAIQDEHWLEAIVLAHMYIETQLRALLFKDNREEGNKRDEPVIKLAEVAFDNKYIDKNVLEKIKDFNTARNDAVHNIASENITFDQLLPTAKLASDLMNELQILNANRGQLPKQEEEIDSTTPTINQTAIKELIRKAKTLAKQYRQLTGKPLGITGEIGEFIAADLLHLELTEARHPGYDAFGPGGEHIQIKSRCILPNAKKGQRIGRIRLDHDFDTVLLVLMAEDFEPLEIFEANFADVKAALEQPGSKSRNVRGSLSISKFKTIGKKVWPLNPD